MTTNKKAETEKALAELPDRVAQYIKKDTEYAKRVTVSRAAAQPILEELRSLGYDILSLADLRHTGAPWKTALPVLRRWLTVIEDPDIKEEIVRCLSVPWIGKQVTADFIEEFQKAPPGSSLAWAIGNALAVVDVRGFEEPILPLCRDRRYGAGRQMIVWSLDRLRSREAEEVALDLLEDPDVNLHAIITLGKMKSKRALFQLEKLLTNERAALRKEARKAITKINRV